MTRPRRSCLTWLLLSILSSKPNTWKKRGWITWRPELLLSWRPWWLNQQILQRHPPVHKLQLLKMSQIFLLRGKRRVKAASLKTKQSKAKQPLSQAEIEKELNPCLWKLVQIQTHWNGGGIVSHIFSMSGWATMEILLHPCHKCSIRVSSQHKWEHRYMSEIIA